MNKNDYLNIFRGKFWNIRDEKTKEIKIFLSSTFSGTI